MAFWNKKRLVTIVDGTGIESLTEAVGYGAQSKGNNLYSFIQGIQYLDTNYLNNDLLIERMMQDSIISAAIDLWLEDSMQKDPLNDQILQVDVESPDDIKEETLAKGLAKELNRFLKDDLNVNQTLPEIIKKVLIYGQVPVKLGFVDSLEDERLLLHENSADDEKRGAQICLKTNKLLDESAFDSRSKMYGVKKEIKTNGADKKSLQEAYRISYEFNLKEDKHQVIQVNTLKEYTEALRDEYKVLTEQVASQNDLILKESVAEEKLKLNENKILLEEVLLDTKRMMHGRWYIQTLGHGTNIYQLKSKQKTIAYIDRDEQNKFIEPDRIVMFSNNTGRHKVNFEVGQYLESIDKKDIYSLERGESFLENAMVAWQVLNALEDILLLTRMTRAQIYKIFQVEVGRKDTEETKKILTDLKARIKEDESIDVRARIYNSSLSGVPLGDSIFIPTRSGVGVIDVKTVGGDASNALSEAIDLPYFRDKLFSGLRIPAAYLNFTEALPRKLRRFNTYKIRYQIFKNSKKNSIYHREWIA